MRAILPALLLLSPALHAAEEPSAPPLPKKKISAISLLPNGSELEGVMLPRYDENHRLSGVLKSGKMIVMTDELIAGEAVVIEFFNPDRSPRGRVDLVKAVFDQAKGLLEAHESVTIRTDRIHAHGSGLIYAFEQGEGFLLGPAVTWIQAATETTMNSRHTPRRAAATAISLMASTTLIAAPPAAPTPEDQAKIQASAVSAAPAHSEASSAARANLRKELDASVAATAAASAFLEQADLAAKAATSTPAPPAAAPLDVKPGPTDTVVSCDGGMYFDADAGVFVYLKNVRVVDPRFALSGANELKIFLAKKPEETPAPKTTETPGKKPAIGLGAKFGDVQRIVATGAVRILQKETEAGKQPVEASGAIFTYHPETGEIVLTGGYPWVKQGTSFMRAKEPNLSLRIQKSGSFVTEGNWDMGGTLDQKR